MFYLGGSFILEGEDLVGSGRRIFCVGKKPQGHKESLWVGPCPAVTLTVSLPTDTGFIPYRRRKNACHCGKTEKQGSPGSQLGQFPHYPEDRDRTLPVAHRGRVKVEPVIRNLGAELVIDASGEVCFWE